MTKDTEFYAIVKYPDNYYEGSDEILGYADNKESANHMVQQARIFYPHDKIGIEQIKHINFLVK